MITAAAACVLVAGFYAAFYSRVIPHWARPVDTLLSHTDLLDRHPRRDVDAVAKLACAGLAQLFFAVLLLVLTGTWKQPLVHVAMDAWLLAVPLGLLEVGAAALVCSAVVDVGRAVDRLSGGRWAAHADTWLVTGRGGWMSQFTTSRRVLPRPWYILIVLGYVVGEETVFRAVLVTTLRPWGPAVAVAVSAALFLTAQLAGMASIDRAVPALAGASVVGPVHGVVYFVTEDLVTVVVAHLVFLTAALATVARPEPGEVRAWT